METRLLTDSTSFGDAFIAQAKITGLLDADGDPTAIFPAIIGMPNDSTDLGAFNIGIIQNNRTIKQALQDLETAVNGRMFASNNLSDLVDKVAARSNLGLGSAATLNIGTSGAVIGALHTINTWTGKQTFSGSIASTSAVDVLADVGGSGSFRLMAGGNRRWAFTKDDGAEGTGTNGSDLRISRFDNTGTLIDHPIQISRGTGVVTLAQPLGIASGGTGSNSLTSLKTTLVLNNVDNTSDANKPISTATQTALNSKLDKTGGSINGYISVSNYARISGTLAIDGNSSEGGQITLGYRNSTGLSGQANSTWNIDVDGDNTFRVFRQGATGTILNALTILESGGATINAGLTVEGSGTVATFSGTTGNSQAIALRHMSASNSVAGSLAAEWRNESNIAINSIFSDIKTDGSADLVVTATPLGVRTSDRKINVMRFGATAITAAVPINGSAYPRRSDGTSISFIASAQSGQPSNLWGTNDNVVMNLYNPSNFSVANSTSLASIVGGNAGGYIRRSSDATANGLLARQLVLAGGSVSDDVWSSPVEIREVNLNGATSNASTYSPGLLFHWSGVASAAFKLYPDGSMRTRTQGTASTYTNFWAKDVYANEWLRVNSTNGLWWEASNRGLVSADNGATYGHVNVSGSGRNGYGGYSINNWAAFIANGTDVGISKPSASSWLLRFDSNNDATFIANITAYSDERLKYNKRPIDNVSERREGMAKAAILYERDGTTRVGFGAQTLELAVPEVVKTADDIIGTKSVNYGDMVAILAVDNQNMSDRIATLETENETLKAALVSLTARLEKAGL